MLGKCPPFTDGSAPRDSIRRKQASNSGAVIFPTGREPRHGKMSFCRRQMIFSECFAAQLVENFANHSRPTASKLSAPAARDLRRHHRAPLRVTRRAGGWGIGGLVSLEMPHEMPVFAAFPES